MKRNAKRNENTTLKLTSVGYEHNLVMKTLLQYMFFHSEYPPQV